MLPSRTALLLGCAAAVLGACANSSPSTTEPDDALRALRFGRADAALPVRVEPDLIFRPARPGEKALRLDLYLPDIDGPHPVAIVIPGGGWRIGHRKTPDCTLLARALAQDGVAAAAVSYRPAPARNHPAQFDDCRDAIRYLRENADSFDLDPTRVVTIGGSAGGHLASLLGTQDADEAAKPNVVVAIAAPFDLTRHEDDTPTPHQLTVLSNFLGLPMARAREIGPAEWLDRLEQLGSVASPIGYLDASDPATLVVHGDDDQIVPLGQAERMCAAMLSVGVPHALHIVPKGGHGAFLFALAAMIEHDLTDEGPRPVPAWWRAVQNFLRAQFEARP